MGSAAQFIAQFFPIFLLGALFGKLMDDSGSVQSIASFMGEKLGHRRAILAVVLAGALVTYGGVSLFVAFFVLAPMARALFRAANIPQRLMPAAIALGTSTFTMSAMPGTPAIQNTIPMPFFGTTPFAAPGLGIIASIIMLLFGLWWLGRAEASARTSGEGFGDAADVVTNDVADMSSTRPRFRTGSTPRWRQRSSWPFFRCWLSWDLICCCQFSYCRGSTSRSWPRSAGAAPHSPRLPVYGALAAASATLIIINWRGLPDLRASMDAGANAAVLPIFAVASLVGFGAVISALPAFALVRDWVLSIAGGPLVSLAIATNILAALTGSASGGLTIALDALGETYLRLAAETGIDPALMHRIAVIGSGTLDSLPHNGAVVTLLAVCGSTHSKSYFDIVMANIVGPILALVAVIFLGSTLGSF
jgi:H+/gluconate symporter-like permease